MYMLLFVTSRRKGSSLYFSLEVTPKAYLNFSCGKWVLDMNTQIENTNYEIHKIAGLYH
jgi:hypothetical protein